MPATLVSCVSIMTSSWRADKLEAYPTVGGNPTSWKLIPLWVETRQAGSLSHCEWKPGKLEAYPTFDVGKSVGELPIFGR